MMTIVAVVRTQVSQARHVSPTATTTQSMEAFVSTAIVHFIDCSDTTKSIT